MSHVFTVISCSYDGTSPNNPNPLCWLHGTVDSVPTAWIGVFYKTIMQAQLAGGQAAVQAVLAPILQSALVNVTGPFPAVPVYSANVSPAPSGSNSVSVAAGLVPQWSA